MIACWSGYNLNCGLYNKDVRKISGEEDVNKVKKAFQKLRKQNIIEPEDEKARTFDFKYKLIEQ